MRVRIAAFAAASWSVATGRRNLARYSSTDGRSDGSPALSAASHCATNAFMAASMAFASASRACGGVVSYPSSKGASSSIQPSSMPIEMTCCTHCSFNAVARSWPVRATRCEAICANISALTKPTVPVLVTIWPAMRIMARRSALASASLNTSRPSALGCSSSTLWPGVTPANPIVHASSVRQNVIF